MAHACKIFVVSLVVVTASIAPALAQRDTPERKSPRGLPVPWQPEAPTVSKSDQYRLVGKVLQIDRAKGLVKLDTDEGVRLVPAPATTLAAIREGDLISVPRSGDEPVNALPRQTPRK
jgi:hypothetical protein